MLRLASPPWVAAGPEAREVDEDLFGALAWSEGAWPPELIDTLIFWHSFSALRKQFKCTCR